MVRKKVVITVNLHVLGDDGDLNEKSSSLPGDPVSMDLISLLLCVRSNLRLFLTIIWLLWRDSESQLLGDMFDNVVSPVADVTAEWLSQARSRLGCGFNMIVIVEFCESRSRFSVTAPSLILITIM